MENQMIYHVAEFFSKRSMERQDLQGNLQYLFALLDAICAVTTVIQLGQLKEMLLLPQ